MNYPLAIFAPTIGGRTETFIQRHMQELLPGRTVVVTETPGGPYGGHWSVDCPSLILERIQYSGLTRRVVSAVARQLGWDPGHHVATVKRFLHEHKVRVAMGEYLDWSEPWSEVAQASGIRFLGHAHGYDVSERLLDPKWRSAYLKYNQAEGIIAVREFSREKLVRLGLDAAKVHVIPCGVDIPAEPLVRTKQKTVRCIAVGRMVAKKGPILTLDAFRRAAEACPELRL